MRKLTIKREKSFVASLIKMKVYIEDPSSSELMINDVPCRKLGTLKNGEECTFEISEDEARVFVIADNASKNYCNDFYRVPQSEFDVFLKGKNKYNPASGNAFRFDGVPSEEVMENRKKGNKKGRAVLITAIIIGVAVGLFVGLGGIGKNNAKPKVFSSNGMSITLTDNFTEETIQGYTVCYGSSDAAVFALRESFDLAEGFEDYTLEEYGELVLKNNKLTNSELKKEQGLTYFEHKYTNSDNGITYSYFSALYKANDAFWMIQFAVPEKDADSFHQKIIEWAGSVKFAD